MFDPETGEGVGGPCRGTTLRELVLRVEDEQVILDRILPQKPRQRPQRKRVAKPVDPEMLKRQEEMQLEAQAELDLVAVRLQKMRAKLQRQREAKNKASDDGQKRTE